MPLIDFETPVLSTRAKSRAHRKFSRAINMNQGATVHLPPSAGGGGSLSGRSTNSQKSAKLNTSIHSSRSIS